MRVAPGVLISPKTTGLAPGTDTSLARCRASRIISAMASALRWMLARSAAMFGIASKPTNSSTIARSCCCRHCRAATAAGFVCATTTAGNTKAINASAYRFMRVPSTVGTDGSGTDVTCLYPPAYSSVEFCRPNSRPNRPIQENDGIEAPKLVSGAQLCRAVCGDPGIRGHSDGAALSQRFEEREELVVRAVTGGRGRGSGDACERLRSA